MKSWMKVGAGFAVLCSVLLGAGCRDKKTTYQWAEHNWAQRQHLVPVGQQSSKAKCGVLLSGTGGKWTWDSKSEKPKCDVCEALPPVREHRNRNEATLSPAGAGGREEGEGTQ